MNSKSRKPFLQKGTVLNGKWEILEHIASGGKGEVYRARQLNLERDVAIKIVSEEFLSSMNGDDEEIETTMNRFRREVLTMAQIRHSNVLQAFDYDFSTIKRGEEEISIEYMAMEHIPGLTLRSTMQEEGMAHDQEAIKKWIINYFFPIIDGIQAIHDVGIVHRDAKPENVLLDDFTPKIMDFGLALSRRWQQLTKSWDVEGTLHYMAPEQFFELSDTDFRADVYALGKILYEAVSGKIKRETPFKTAKLTDPDTPFLKRLDRIIQQATAEEREERIPSVKELKDALTGVLDDIARSISQREGFWERKRRSNLRVPLLVSAVGFTFLGLIGLAHLLWNGKFPLPIIPWKSSVEDSRKAPGLEQTNSLPSQNAKRLSPAPTFRGQDGVNLHLIPGGDLILPEDFGPRFGKTVKVDSFYMDETEVTNHQYIEFLNQVLPKIRVDGGVVQGDGKIWLLLGEVFEGYEPIVYRDGKFLLTDPASASNPVVRVAGYGAAAYARFYGRRLPTDVEWLYALGNKGESPGGSLADTPGSPDGMESGGMHGQMHSSSSQPQDTSQFLSPVSIFKPNAYGIRGLEGNVSEWGRVLGWSASQENERSEYVIMGGLSRRDSAKGQALAAAISRQPWEAFEKVGFRCAQSITIQGK
jgi:serine/threonine-protein kinase